MNSTSNPASRSATNLPPLPELRSVAVGGRTLAWREAGSGDPLVLVHGIGGHSGSWRRQLAALSRNLRVIAWDAPGYGGSDPLPADARADRDYSAALAALLKALDVRAPHLVGHSLGSIMIASAVRHHNVAARSLAFVQPVTGGGSMPEDARARMRAGRIADMRQLGAREFALQRGRTILSPHADPARVQEAMAVMEVVPADGYLAAWDMLCASDLFALLDPRWPAMVVCGSDDPVCPPQTARAIADRIEGCRYHCLDRVGHYAAIEAHEQLNDLLQGFVLRDFVLQDFVSRESVGKR